MQESYANAVEGIIVQLVEVITAHEPDWEPRVGEMDRSVQQLLRRIGRAVCERLLNSVSRRLTDAARAEGLTVERRPIIDYFGLFGSMRVESPYLYDRKTGRSARPMRDGLGIGHRDRSQALERALTDFGAEESYGQSAERFEEHYGWSVPPATIRRITLSSAQRAERHLQAHLAKERLRLERPSIKRRGVDQLLVELDGSMVRTGVLKRIDGDGKTPVRGLPRACRKEEWREVRVGLARPLKASERTYVAAMAPYPDIVSSLFDAAVSRGLSLQSETIAVADGGNGLKEELDAQFPNLTFILDRPHLLGHLYETADAIGLEDQERREWVQRHIQRVDAGQVVRVMTELNGHRGKGQDRTRQLAGYLRRFRQSVHYDDYKARGFPVGSGEVESAHRSIPQKRLKKPGACWKPENINPMLALRVVRANGQWEQLWAGKTAA